ncbi:hypothetical protein V8E53_002828 [Lactarius tabidus]
MWRLKKKCLPWTLVPKKPMYRTGECSHGFWAMSPRFRQRCEDTAITRSPGRIQDPRRELLPHPLHSNTLDPLPFSNSPYVIAHRVVIATTRRGVCPKLLLRLWYCGQEPNGGDVTPSISPTIKTAAIEGRTCLRFGTLFCLPSHFSIPASLPVDWASPPPVRRGLYFHRRAAACFVNIDHTFRSFFGVSSKAFFADHCSSCHRLSR